MDNWASFAHTYMYDLSTFRPMCIYGSQYHIHAAIYPNLNFKKWFAINCTNSDRLDGFPHKREMSIWSITSCRWHFWPVKTILWFFAFVVWRLAKVKESEIIVSNVWWLHTTEDHRFKAKNKKSAIGVILKSTLLTISIQIQPDK